MLLPISRSTPSMEGLTCCNPRRETKLITVIFQTKITTAYSQFGTTSSLRHKEPEGGALEAVNGFSSTPACDEWTILTMVHWTSKGTNKCSVKTQSMNMEISRSPSKDPANLSVMGPGASISILNCSIQACSNWLWQSWTKCNSISPCTFRTEGG